MGRGIFDPHSSKIWGAIAVAVLGKNIGGEGWLASYHLRGNNG